MIKFELQQNEAEFIVAVLGQLPTQSNAHSLWVKLTEQYKEQAPQTAKEDKPKGNLKAVKDEE